MTTVHAASRLTGPTETLPRSILDARAALAAATADYLEIADEALERPWTWRDHELDVRYGIYRAAESIEEASSELEAAFAGAPVRPPATLRVAPATAARWALQGRLAALDDSILDRVPRDGEWTARQTLGHTIDGQRSYGWFSRWWLSLPLGPDRPARVTEEAEKESDAELPGEEAESAGSISDLRARLDNVVDEWALRFAGLDDAALATPATWSGTPVDIDFRLGRWASHIAEHAIQLDKTLDWLDYQPREVERIVRDLHAAWGRLESRIFPLAPAGTDPIISDALARLSARLTVEARSVRAAAEA